MDELVRLDRLADLLFNNRTIYNIMIIGTSQIIVSIAGSCKFCGHVAIKILR